MIDARRTAVSGGIVLAAALIGVTGCSAEAAPAASDPPPSGSGSASPAPTLEPAGPDTTLFTVEAGARAVDGTTLDLLLTGYAPVESTATDAVPLVDDFLGLCTDLGGLSVSEAGRRLSEESLAEFGSSLMRIDYSSTPEERSLLAPVEVIVGIDNFARVASGDGVAPLLTTETCLNRYQLVESGSGSFIANYESGTSTADPEQWRYGSYGFTVPVDSGATLESCLVTVTPLARRALTDISGWADGEVGTGISCGTGYLG